MRSHRATALLLLAVTWLLAPQAAFAEKHNVPPEGFVALFNGKDLSGWRGLGHADPRKLAAMGKAKRAVKQAADDANLRQHWKAEEGQIINDGKGVYLTTAKNYADFELRLDWKMVQTGTDSGIYLRGCPQVQIWDPADPKAKKHGADKGSGALWNNNKGSEGRFPLVVADRPVGEWNTFHIRMVGDRVTVHFNDKLVVDGAVMHNYFDRKGPMFEKGPIQLQTHGGEMRFRNVFIREIARSEAAAAK